jgi:hypothetical protein
MAEPLSDEDMREIADRAAYGWETGATYPLSEPIVAAKADVSGLLEEVYYLRALLADAPAVEVEHGDEHYREAMEALNRAMATPRDEKDGLTPQVLPYYPVEVGHGETPPTNTAPSLKIDWEATPGTQVKLDMSHKVSVTGMTHCKICDSKIEPGQTFYFFGTDGPYCAVCYADDPRKKGW